MLKLTIFPLSYSFTGVTNIISAFVQNGADDMVSNIYGAINWQSVIVLLTNQDDIKLRNSVFLFFQNYMVSEHQETALI